METLSLFAPGNSRGGEKNRIKKGDEKIEQLYLVSKRELICKGVKAQNRRYPNQPSN